MKKNNYSKPTTMVVTMQLTTFIADSIHSVSGGPAKGDDIVSGEANSRNGGWFDDED